MFFLSFYWWFGLAIGLCLGVYLADHFSENIRWFKTVITMFWLSRRK